MSVKQAISVLLVAVENAERERQPRMDMNSHIDSFAMRDWMALGSIAESLRRAEELYSRGVIKEVSDGNSEKGD